MSNLLQSIVPAAIALTLACGSVAAHATGNGSEAGMPAVAQSHVDSPQQTAPVGTSPAQHELTRQDVYNQLVQAERDGTLARLNALYYGS
ncbi:hypothetical protein WJ542_21090 [Paraburkholderia sp. B3]|uniref:DUF4148 domain-containing protein n=1 Tax=Paraburkholderia sp. B3 TaxID=3134791 RepID=UPI003981AF7C